jgi:large subunit ribosomal protein L10e
MYTQVKGQAYTRQEYMGGVPHVRITQFDLGNVSREFGLTLSLVADETCVVRHTALESARVAANRYLTRRVGETNFHMKILVYPHHVLRENKQATGAGADRVSMGMRSAFGKPVGTGARVQRDQELIKLRVDEQNLVHAKIALKRAGAKFPTPCRIIVEKATKFAA